MTRSWYVHFDGQTRGPLSEEHLRELIRDSQVSLDDWVWRAGQKDWAAVRTTALAAAVSNVPDALPPRREPPPPRIPEAARTPAAVRASPRRPSGFPAAHYLVFGGVLLVLLGGVVGWWLRGASLSTGRSRAGSPVGKPSRVARARPRLTGDAARTSAAPAARLANERPASSEVRRPPASPSIRDEAEESWQIANAEPGEMEPAARGSTELVERSAGELGSAVVDAPDRAAADRSEPPRALLEKQPQPSNDLQRPAAVQTLFETVEVQRETNMSVSGTPFAQRLHYVVESELALAPANADGARKVRRTVTQARLLACDDLSRTLYENALRSLHGGTFEFTLTRSSDIADFRSSVDTKAASSPIEALRGKGFVLTSLIDEDGWKEISQLSLFHPPDDPQARSRWERQMTHDWGSLGRWTGVTTFMPREGSQRPEEEFQYTHRMSYSAPPEASEGPGGLPLRITAARFEPLAAGGTIDYDSAAGRVRTAAERFAVRGVLEASALGQPVEVQLEETQFLEITLTDQR